MLTSSARQSIDLEVVIEGDAVVRQRARDLERREHAGRAVEPAAARHRIGVRADHDRAAAGHPSGPAADEVAARIDTDAETGLLHAAAQPRAPFEETVREGAAGPGPVGIGDLGERHQVVPEAAAVDGQVAGAHGRIMAQPLATGCARGGRTNRPSPGCASTRVPSKTRRPRL